MVYKVFDKKSSGDAIENKNIWNLELAYCVISIFSKHAWVIHLKDKRLLQLLMLFRKFYMNQNANQIKYGLTKAVNFIIDQWNQFCRIIIWKCVQRIMKKNIVLLKDSLEPQRTKFINTWLQYQKMPILTN